MPLLPMCGCATAARTPPDLEADAICLYRPGCTPGLAQNAANEGLGFCEDLKPSAAAQHMFHLINSD